MILQLEEHLLHVGKPQLALVVLLERMQLLCRDRVGLDGAFLGEERAHVADEGSYDSGGQFYRLAGHGAEYRRPAGNYESCIDGFSTNERLSLP